MNKQITITQLTPPVQSLVEIIRIEIEQGRERAYLAMEQEKRLTYWNVGKHIKQHLLQNEGREDYASYVIPQLSNELDISRSVLYDSVQFYEQYPNIVPAQGQFTWSHIRVLLSVSDKQARQQFEAKIIAENLSSRELQKLVKNDKSQPKIPVKTTLADSRGKPYVYKLKKVQKSIMVDLGFRFYIKNQFPDAKIDSLIQIEKNNDKYSYTNIGKGKAPHYIYKAYVIEIIDGDTLWVNIDLGFDNWTTQKIRLMGINTKDIETPEGKTAKEYMESRLKGCKFIAIKTYWRDKFTRYLVNIFYKKRETDLYKIAETGKFLNQELLDTGLAVKY